MLTWEEVTNPEERKLRPTTGYALDTDTLPLDVANGTKVIIMNKSKIKFFDAENVKWWTWGT